MDENEAMKYAYGFQDACLEQAEAIKKIRTDVDHYEDFAKVLMMDDETLDNYSNLIKKDLASIKEATKVAYDKEEKLLNKLSSKIGYTKAHDLIHDLKEALYNEVKRQYGYDTIAYQAKLADDDEDYDKEEEINKQLTDYDKETDKLDFEGKVYLLRVEIELILMGKSIEEAQKEAEKGLKSLNDFGAGAND